MPCSDCSALHGVNPNLKKYIFVITIIVVVVIIIIVLTHSQTIQGNTVEIKPQSVALDFKNLSQYSSRSK